MSSQGTTTTPKFPKFAKDSMRKINRYARDMYESDSTAFLPELNKWTTQGLEQRAGIAAGGNSITNPGLQEASKILSGGYLDVTQDPNYQRSINSALGAASDRFAGSGRVGSGAYAGALGDAAAGVAAQMYDQERSRQMQTLGMLPQLTASQYADSGYLEDAGRAMDEDTMARFDWPYARLDRLANTVYGSPATQIPGQTSSRPLGSAQNILAGTLGALKPLSNSSSGGY